MLCHFENAGLQIGLLGRHHSCHLFEVLCSLFFHDVHRVVDGDDTHQAVFGIHYGKGRQIVLVEKIDYVLPVVRGPCLDDAGIHDILDQGLIGIHEKVLDRDDTLQGALVVHDIAGVDRLLVHAVLTDVGKGVLHCHGLPESDVLRCHDGAGGILGVFQEFIDLGPGLGRGILQHTLDDVRRQLLHHVDGIIDGKIFDDVRQLFIRDAGYDVLLLVQFQTGKDVRSEFLRQHAEDDHCLFRVELFDKGCHVDLVHFGEYLAKRTEFLGSHKLQKSFVPLLFFFDLTDIQFCHRNLLFSTGADRSAPVRKTLQFLISSYRRVSWSGRCGRALRPP